ncbi:hypothetical protein AAFF_G00059150 [Aldrovandia affinis]|uniref:B30.2/SPRY domain-containing protein n=1 Tax=Aldrovandia affinis TaxID=143900 RepID=A0AAD7R1L8_9TELE|nr:hypothetical protein AAFF_G00059150 [Aldrovandia affinis]
MRSEVKELIRDQEKAAVSRAERQLEWLEQEIAELRRREAELEQFSHTEDDIHFLQSCQSVCAPPGPGDLPRITVNPHVSFEAMSKHVSELKERLEDICKGEFVKITQTVNNVHILEPRIREDFLQCESVIKPDPNTAYRYLRLSEGNRKVKRVRKIQSYRNHSERFDRWAQVLCREGLSGRCYWEVEWSGELVSINVSYKEISRKGGGDDCHLGYNDKSWRLACFLSRCHFMHNKEITELPASPSSRIGVYLDHGAGDLSFYNVSDTMTLLHRVKSKFTQPLHPGFGLNLHSSVKLCDLG